MLKLIILQLTTTDTKAVRPYEKIEGFLSLLEDLKKNEVKIQELALDQPNWLPKEIPDKEERSCQVISKINSIVESENAWKECLIISDLECVMEAAVRLKIPIIGFDVPELGQDLFQADMLVQGFEEVDYTFVMQVYQRFYHEPVMIAKTSRLIIREMVLEDLDELYELYAHPTITKFLEPLYEREMEIEYTKAYIKNMYGFYGYGLWSLIEKKTGRLIGRAGLNNRRVDGEIQIELGYLIGVAYQNQGFATEACNKILEFAVKNIDCTKVNCFIHRENHASIALVKKLGFVYLKDAEIDKESLSWYRWTYAV
ncbi:RimJ/RimL family protein N-acetyltransferase [Lachnotalea glycerini]|uniref:RimJ/RimL family protein N-acetyltransferase n=1 Tax=Lachnotalea glycerini TaxID=1763509 RepID=A0A318EQ38_9FIRM|nr:GNAT family N-acetyltransferase [Lachnotalea glycerini]PXV91496.1 RimJ/RimL family protein N-acetyltransferase [Lachnotalea glycerini]